MQMEKGDVSFEWSCSSCLLEEEGSGDGEIVGLERQKKGLASYNPELKREVKDFACFWGSRHIILPVPVDQECQAAYL